MIYENKICENKKNNKYCEGKINKKEKRIINGMAVCVRCYFKLKRENKEIRNINTKKWFDNKDKKFKKTYSDVEEE